MVLQSQFLNRQIYYCIQFAIYGRRLITTLLLPHPSNGWHEMNCIKAPNVSERESRRRCWGDRNYVQADVWHSFILVVLCSIFFHSPLLSLRGVYNTKINFFAQNNIQFSIITLLLSNSLTCAISSSPSYLLWTRAEQSRKKIYKLH